MGFIVEYFFLPADVFFLRPKVIQGFLLALMILREMQIGFLNHFPSFVKTHPFRSYWKYLALLIFLILLMIPMDVPLISSLQAVENTPLFKAMLAVGRFFGRNLWLFLAGIYSLAILGKNRSFQELIFGGLMSGGLAGLLGHLLKFIFLRSRPDNGWGSYSFFNFKDFVQDPGAVQSFPSGDVSIVAGAAGYLFFRFCRYPASWLILGVPLFTALSRMTLNRHWPSDTLFAIGLGLFIGHFISCYKDGSEAKKSVLVAS